MLLIYDRICVPNITKYINLKVLNIIAGTK